MRGAGVSRTIPGGRYAVTANGLPTQAQDPAEPSQPVDPVGPDRPALARFAAKPVAAVVLLQATVLTALSGRYGFHRDELYFLAAGKRLAWGYVDQPPLTPLIARASTAVFGQSPAGLRAAATVCGAVAVLVAALIARELGGTGAAQTFTGACTASSGFILGVTHMFVTPTLDLVAWLALAWLVLRMLRTGDRRWWIAIGAVFALGMYNKWLVPLLAVALVAAVLAVGPRRMLAGRWPVLGTGLAVAMALPMLVWQARNGWPLLTVAGGISAKDGAGNRALFVPDQLLYISPVLVPTMIAGGLRLWRDPDVRWARAFPLAYLILCAELLASGGKPYYPIPMLLVFVAAGAPATLRTLRRAGAAARAGAYAAFAIGAVVSLLAGLPILPPSALGGPILALNKEQGEQIGWPSLTAAVAQVWQQIPPGERAKAVILAENYGEAGAVEFYGGRYGLPQPYSGHMSYSAWGPPSDAMTGPVLLIREKTDSANTYLLDDFTDCTVRAHQDNGYGLANEESATQIWLCAAPSEPWSVLWPALRHYY